MVALFGRYEYLHELGQGGSGRVFAVRDLADEGALRAIKVVAGADASRLAWEFARLSRLEHIGIARVRELLRVDEPEHAPFRITAPSLLLVEDLAPGEPLSRVAHAELDPSLRQGFVLRVALAAAEGLAAIHAAGLVHGDVKPDNVLVTEGGANVTLVDLGFCAPPGWNDQPHGTPRFMAPELLAGVSSPAADVYALGGMIFDWLLGEAPEPSSSRGRGALFVRRLEALRGRITPEFSNLLATFLEPDPAARVSDGFAAHAALLPIAQALGLVARTDPALFTGGLGAAAQAARARTLPFVGRSELVTALCAGLEGQAAMLVAGARGAGRTRLVREALRQLTLRRAESGAILPTVVRSVEGLARVRDVPAVLWLEPSALDLSATMEAALRLRAIRPGQLAVVIECDPFFQHSAALRVEVGPLASAEIALLLAELIAPHHVTPALLEAASRTAQGMAGRLCELTAEALAAQRDIRDPRSFAACEGQGDTLALSPEALRLACLFAWAGRGLSPADCMEVLPAQSERERAFEELWARALVVRRGTELELAPHVARELRARSFERRAAIIEQVPERTMLEGGFACVARGRLGQAEQAFTQTALELRRLGELEPALSLLREAVALVPSEALRWWLADTERAHASYAQAAQTLSGSVAPAARLLLAEVLRLRGEREGARAVVLALTEPSAGTEPALRDRALALLARIHFDLGDVHVARAEAEALSASQDREASVRALEVRLLVELATGLPARGAADSLVRTASAFSSHRFLARALTLRAQLSARHGEQTGALNDTTRALELARKAGEAHEAASYALNLGLLQMEAGELGLAHATLQDAAFSLSRIDRPGDLARVLYNLSALSLLIGDDAGARAMVAAAEQFAAAGGDPAVRAFLKLITAELCLRQGQLEAAAAEIDAALSELPEGLGPVRAVVSARAVQAQLLCGRMARAEQWLRVAQAEHDAADVSTSLEVRVAELRYHLARGEPESAERVAERGMELLAGQAPFAERLRFLLAAIEAARAMERESATRERTLLCRALLEAALAGLPPALRAAMRERPEHVRVLSASAPQREGARHLSSDRWRRLVQSSRRLFGTAQRARIAAQLVDLTLELVHGERALLVASKPDGTLEVRAQASLVPEAERVAVFSRSVVERVWSEGKPLVTIEASRDLRLHAAQSIHALSVRSVLAVPVDGFGEPTVLYLDDRLRAEAFDAEDLDLVEDLAALAREALRAAQARQSQARRARKAEEEASSLALALTQEASGASAKALPLVGTSRALLRVTDAARRVAGSDVSVLVTGESGTGKELLARLIHDESVRRSQPFVAESCAALPDTLLESALFGHVRGAFTGADRARRGLFEAADKGTLFLDEVGEMSPALQAKLLRVLQEGELRPLGSERTRHVDVRVIAATRRDLRARVQEGTFREDLYYRLAVVTLELPSLAARREDIPLLVRHFLAKHQTKGRAATITPMALRQFCEREYPGNVRQLENEVRRALALGDNGRIDADLVLVAENAIAPGLAELDLHAQVDALTQRLVEQALERAEGNVTQAALLLGISRFGLQKMLKRKPGHAQRK